MNKIKLYIAAHQIAVLRLLWYVQISDIIQLHYRKQNTHRIFITMYQVLMKLCKETTGHALRHSAAQTCETLNNVLLYA